MSEYFPTESDLVVPPFLEDSGEIRNRLAQCAKKKESGCAGWFLIGLVAAGAMYGAAHPGGDSVPTPHGAATSCFSKADLQPTKTLPHVSINHAKAVGQCVTDKTWGDSKWLAVDKMLEHESNWRSWAVNPDGGACGIVQAWPCDKLSDKSLYAQMHFFTEYIKEAYDDNPDEAWNDWQARNPHWY